MNILLDNNAIDKLAQNIDLVINHPEIKLFICNETVGEVSNNKKYNPKPNVTALLKARVNYLPNAVFVLGHSNLDSESTFCSSKVLQIYNEVLNENRSNIPDAIIAATAVANDYLLLTDDGRLIKKMVKYSYPFMTFSTLKYILTHK